jgi:hypothetical protein
MKFSCERESRGERRKYDGFHAPCSYWGIVLAIVSILVVGMFASSNFDIDILIIMLPPVDVSIDKCRQQLNVSIKRDTYSQKNNSTL